MPPTSDSFPWPTLASFALSRSLPLSVALGFKYAVRLHWLSGIRGRLRSQRERRDQLAGFARPVGVAYPV